MKSVALFFWGALTGFGNLCFCAALYGINKGERKSRARDLLETFDLAKAARA